MIDFETTGFVAEHHDRVIEVAVVHVSPDGLISGRWETLVNPGRDLGRQDIHGITAREILGAPAFADIVADLVELLTDRVIVAHNASFDLRFLNAELARAGYRASADFSSVCTMRVSRALLGGGGSLADCCAAFDIELTGAHRALVDATATAELLAALIASTDREYWVPAFEAVSPLAPHVGQRAAWFAREDGDYAPTFLERIVDRVPDVADTLEQAEYLAFLERCLLDRYLSEHEMNALVTLADELGVGRTTAERLHTLYFQALAAAAWADGIVTELERDDLLTVAQLLSIPAEIVSTALEAPSTEVAAQATATAGFDLAVGDAVVLTGDMLRPRAAWEATLVDLGYVVKPAVTKTVKLVVAADPDSLSGKAKKARDYGIPIVGEPWLLDLTAATV
ncbi:exonuclease domain-containing protein [Microbacterium sp. NPDC056044]|uniref:exonuclease domain-containing protein n=1 Tax=Microbacterium sp. NPDC056044 TaxID=3345690 RepID=UPI0035DDDAF5